MNHAHYFEIFEDARWELITRNGYGMDRIRQTGQGPTILEIRIPYRRELKARRRIRVETRCLSYAREVARIAQRMIDEGGEECCTAELPIGLLDLRKRRLILPTEEWKHAIGVE